MEAFFAKITESLWVAPSIISSVASKTEFAPVWPLTCMRSDISLTPSPTLSCVASLCATRPLYHCFHHL